MESTIKLSDELNGMSKMTGNDLLGKFEEFLIFGELMDHMYGTQTTVSVINSNIVLDFCYETEFSRTDGQFTVKDGKEYTTKYLERIYIDTKFRALELAIKALTSEAQEENESSQEADASSPRAGIQI